MIVHLLCLYELPPVSALSSALQLRGVSTFLAEMLDASVALRGASAASFLLIDELGRGTSTSDGMALAASITEYIADKIGAFCMFSTHFADLATLADNNNNVANAHVDATPSPAGVTFHFRVRPGASSRAFGLDVAALAGIPSAIVEDARREAAVLDAVDCAKRDIHGGSDDDEAALQGVAAEVESIAMRIQTASSVAEAAAEAQRALLQYPFLAPVLSSFVVAA